MDQQVTYKKRRIQRACDVCRRKKSACICMVRLHLTHLTVKCDGESAPEAPCVACIAFREQCTWNTEAKKRGPPRKDVQALEARVAFLENMLQQKAAKPTPSVEPRISSFSPPHDDSSSGDMPAEDESNEDKIETLAERMGRLEMDAGANFTHVGESSGSHLAGKVWQIRADIQSSTHRDDTPGPVGIMDFWEREENEKWRNWEANLRFSFPEPDLLAALVDAYMIHVNAWTHLLHRPTFEAAVADRLHERDNSFACVLLLVCAHGSRYVDDPRVCLPETSQRSAGWPFYRQVPISRWELTTPPRLYNVQMYCLAAQFISTVVHRLAWKLIGIGIRMCQEIGMQHRILFGYEPHPYHELWKRCFWVLFAFDILWASETGRPSSWHEADFDIDLPLDCDDEYWFDSDTSKAFRQPSGQPSGLSQYVELLKLKLIHMRALRELFSPASSKKLKNPALALADIDSEINNWANNLPVHLRWNPVNPALEHNALLQTGLLQLECNQLRLTIHRPFVAVRKPTAVSSASHAICTLAARANSRIATVILNRLPSGYPLPAMMLMFAHSAAIVLLLNYWGTQRTNMRADPTGTMEDVESCLSVIRSFKNGLHSRISGLLHDQLTRMASRSDMPLPPSMEVGSAKRPRDTSDSPSIASASTSNPYIARSMPSMRSLPHAPGGLPGPPSLDLSFDAPPTWKIAELPAKPDSRDTPPVVMGSPTMFWQRLVSGEISPSGGSPQQPGEGMRISDTDDPPITHSFLDDPSPAHFVDRAGVPLVPDYDRFAWDDELLSLWTTQAMNNTYAGVQSEHPDHLFYPSHAQVESRGAPEHVSHAYFSSW